MNLLQFDSSRAWANGVATFWRDRLRARPSMRICLPTGLTPNPVYAEMVRSVRAGEVSFADATVYALDEFGGLAAHDPGRTKNMLLHHWVAHVDLREEACHFLDAEAPDVDEQCRRFDRAAADGFDLVILGLGLNGHL